MNTTIPDKKGVLSVTGLEAEVGKFRLQHEYLKFLDDDQSQQKVRFREEAERLIKEAGPSAKRIDFIGDKAAGAVKVSFPDETKEANRLVLKADLEAQVKSLGLDLEGMGLLEKKMTITLTGDWASWFLRDILPDTLVRMQQPYPEGLEQKETVRLTLDGIQQLRAIAEAGEGTYGEAAQSVLKAGVGIKSASVGVR